VMPYMLLNSSKQFETESITLFFSAGNFTTIFVGLLSFALPYATGFFTTEMQLILYSSLGLVGIFFIMKLPSEEKVSKPVPLASLQDGYDWNLILHAVVPTFLISLGAGFTIPVINLFFHDVHGMNASVFSLMNSVAFTLVMISALAVPEIKRRFGYQVAITLMQSVAIVLLFLMATTEWYNHTTYALLIAAVTFTLRQPLMNMAGPMTSELTMSYVGEKNREMISAINASIWSGCWFVSAKVFSVLREAGVAYSNIILITVGLYIVGVVWYYGLIQQHEKRETSL
jgi:hypothetical protein